MNMSFLKSKSYYFEYSGRILCFFVLSAVCVMMPRLSTADEWHYKDIIIGDRPAGMGGAYTAVSDTPEGVFYNPAGIVYSVGRSLSVSVNAYHNSWKEYQGVLGEGDWNRRSSSLIPNFFGMVQPLGNGYIGFSYAVPDIIEEDQNQLFRNIGSIDKYIINLSNLDKTYKIGPSYAMKLTDNLSVGATLYLHYRQQKLVFNQYLLFSDTSFEWSNGNIKQSEYGIDPKLGIMWSPADKLSIGLTVSKTEIFSSNRRTQNIVRTDAGLVMDMPDPSIVDSSEKAEYPLSVSLGTAWFPSESLLVAFDLDYYSKVSADSRQDVLNASAGIEYYLSERYALRGGLYSNMAASPDLSAGVSDQAEQVHLYGMTASISRFTRSTAMSLGMNYSYGKGEAQPVAGDADIYDLKVRTLTLFLSGSYSY